MHLQTFRGTWKEIGAALGASQTGDVRRVLRAGRMTARLRALIPEQIRFLRDTAPNQWDFIEGMASGARVSVDHVAAVHSWEYDYLGTTGRGREHCTTALVTDRAGRCAIAHNEDEDVAWRRHFGFVRLIPVHAPAILAFQYRGMLPGAAVGVNEAGIGIATDNIWRKSRRPRIGLPPTVLGLLFSESTNQERLFRVYRSVRTNSGCHCLMTHETRSWACELFHDAKEWRSVRPGYAHANHAVFKKTAPGSYASQNSIERYAAISSAVRERATIDCSIRCLRRPTDRGGAYRPNRLGKDVTLLTAVAMPAKRRIDVWTTVDRKTIRL